MVYVSLPEDFHSERPSFYLALEEYLATTKAFDDMLFVWQVGPSVIFGRNQLAENEVNIGFCRERKIGMYRRKSGGGCVYADKGNLMISYITKEEPVGLTFSRYLGMVSLSLRLLGIESKASGRNDLMIGDRKVSGNSFWHVSPRPRGRKEGPSEGRNIVHGTLLCDTCMENMIGSLTPDSEKLKSKGVSSIRERIALLKDFTPMGPSEIKSHIRATLCGDEEIILGQEDIREAESLEKEYLSEAFIYGKNPKYTLTRRGRIEGVGQMEISLEVKGGVIRALDIHGDYFITGDIGGKIISPLIGVRLEEGTLRRALPDNIGDIILNITKEDLINLLLGIK